MDFSNVVGKVMMFSPNLSVDNSTISIVALTVISNHERTKYANKVSKLCFTQVSTKSGIVRCDDNFEST